MYEDFPYSYHLFYIENVEVIENRLTFMELTFILYLTLWNIAYFK